MKFKATKTFNKPYISSEILGLYQEGGEMVQGEPANLQEEDPMQQLLMMASQAVETQDGQLALQVCQVLVEMASGMEQAPEETPGQAPEENV